MRMRAVNNVGDSGMDDNALIEPLRRDVKFSRPKSTLSIPKVDIVICISVFCGFLTTSKPGSLQ